jgi:protein-L-isoaspartate(D-aspartate) O-methyltransferase
MMHALDLEKARFNMIEQQIRPWNVLDQQVLDTMSELPRDLFVPPGYASLAYADTEIPIGHGHHMMAPKIEGHILQALAIQPKETVLEIGTGSGYLSACMSRLARQVHSVDIHEDFTTTAASNFKSLGLQNIVLYTDNAAEGWGKEDRYDAIAVTASMPEYLPVFESSLTIGGRLFVVVGQAPAMEAILITRINETDYSRRSLFETSIEPLDGLIPPKQFEF